MLLQRDANLDGHLAHVRCRDGICFARQMLEQHGHVGIEVVSETEQHVVAHAARVAGLPAEMRAQYLP